MIRHSLFFYVNICPHSFDKTITVLYNNLYYF